MKIIILSNILFIIILESALTQPVKEAAINNSADLPRISFSETENDFGVIDYGKEAVHYFVFINEGKVPLVITNVRTSCGCTVPAWPKAPVGAGRKDSLKVEYNTKVKGSFNKTISVYSNATNSIVELRIKGNVIK
jgi:hypothetical protein